MKKTALILLIFAATIGLFATNYIFIYHKDKTITPVERATIDSIKFLFQSNRTYYT